MCVKHNNTFFYGFLVAQHDVKYSRPPLTERLEGCKTDPFTNCHRRPRTQCDIEMNLFDLLYVAAL